MQMSGWIREQPASMAARQAQNITSRIYEQPSGSAGESMPDRDIPASRRAPPRSRCACRRCRRTPRHRRGEPARHPSRSRRRCAPDRFSINPAPDPVFADIENFRPRSAAGTRSQFARLAPGGKRIRTFGTAVNNAAALILRHARVLWMRLRVEAATRTRPHRCPRANLRGDRAPAPSGGMRSVDDDYMLRDPRLIDVIDEHPDRIRHQIVTVFPNFVVQKTQNAMALRFFTPRPPLLLLCSCRRSSRRESGSHPTRQWREPDSNRRSRVTQPRFRGRPISPLLDHPLTEKSARTYDSRKLFATTVVNELGHQVDYIYEYGTGTKLETEGPNTRTCTTNCPAPAPIYPLKEQHKVRVDGLV